MLRDEGVAELLPACNTVIFDEAHQLPETASLFFGESVSTAQLIELARDTRLEAAAAAKDFAALPEAAQALDKAARDLRLARRRGQRAADCAAVLDNRAAISDSALDAVAEKLAALGELLESQAERSEGLENCWQRAVPTGRQARRAGARQTRAQSKNRCAGSRCSSDSLQLNATPLSIADIFRARSSGSARAWIFTSATLSVSGDFSHYQREMGLAEARTASWDSPFDYPRPGAALRPRAACRSPNSAGYTRRWSRRRCR